MNCELTPAERRLLTSLSTPAKVQRFLDDRVAYNREPEGETCRSPRRVMRDRVGHCLEGAMLAAAALRLQGHPPLLIQLEAVRDVDHVVALFRQGAMWGAVAKSNYSGLRFREPVYRTLRELAMSYFEHYFNLAREKTLRAYSRPVNLDRFSSLGWVTADRDLWEISDCLSRSPRIRLIAQPAPQRLNRVDGRLFRAGCFGMSS